MIEKIINYQRERKIRKEKNETEKVNFPTKVKVRRAILSKKQKVGIIL